MFKADLSSASECLACSSTFGLIKRKHNCDACGFVFCSNCLKKGTCVLCVGKEKASGVSAPAAAPAVAATTSAAPTDAELASSITGQSAAALAVAAPAAAAAAVVVGSSDASPAPRERRGSAVYNALAKGIGGMFGGSKTASPDAAAGAAADAAAGEGGAHGAAAAGVASTSAATAASAAAAGRDLSHVPAGGGASSDTPAAAGGRAEQLRESAGAVASGIATGASALGKSVASGGKSVLGGITGLFGKKEGGVLSSRPSAAAGAAGFADLAAADGNADDGIVGAGIGAPAPVHVAVGAPAASAGPLLVPLVAGSAVAAASASAAASPAAASPAATAAGDDYTGSTAVVAQSLWYAARRGSLVAGGQGLGSTRGAAPLGSAAAAGEAAISPVPISSSFLYTAATPAELKTAKRYKFLGGFNFDWKLEQVLPPAGGARQSNAISALVAGTTLHCSIHCKPKARTNNIFSVGVIPFASPFLGAAVAKIAKAPDGRVFMLVNFNRRAIIKFFGRIHDTAEVKGRFVAVDHDSGVELSGSGMLVESLDGEEDASLAGDALGIALPADEVDDDDDDEEEEEEAAAAAKDGASAGAESDSDAEGAEAGDLASPLQRTRSAAVVKKHVKLFRVMTKRSGLAHAASEDVQDAAAWCALFANVFGQRFDAEAVLAAANK